MNKRKSSLALAALAFFALLMLSGCRETQPPLTHTQGIYMLLDISEISTLELKKAQAIIHYILGSLNPADSFAVAPLDRQSVREKKRIHQITFDKRPSVATNQKRVFAHKVGSFIKKPPKNPGPDIAGGLLLAVEWLSQTKAGKKKILIFSDMEEGSTGPRGELQLPLKGFTVIALNVTTLRSDSTDPRDYLDRLNGWRLKVESGGGSWLIINDLARLEPVIGP
ncbi:MAG: hypothetical protein RI601_00745 [Desulfurivibrionaceae bacterium]|nr:hypothetical protein [Desulfurivibrionaceae bacterium]